MKFISTYVAAARGFNKRVPPFKPTLYPLSAAGLGVQPSNIMDIKSSKLPGNCRIAVIATPGRDDDRLLAVQPLRNLGNQFTSDN
jgi:hypothetical protein